MTGGAARGGGPPPGPRDGVALTGGVTAVLLALLTALAYGLANFLGPQLSLRHTLGPVLVVGQVAGVAGGVVLVALDGSSAPGGRALAFGVAAGLANAVAIACFFTAAARGPMSVVAPLGATGGMVPVLVALATGERPGALQMIGIPLAVIGVVAAAAKPTSGRGAHASTATIGLTLLSAAAFGLFLTTFAEASSGGPAWAVLVSRVALLASTFTWLTVRGGGRWVSAADLPAVALPGLLLVVGTAAYGVATTQGLVSVVSVLATLAPVVMVGLAVVVLHERLAARQWAGVALALTGLVLLAAG